MSPHKENKKQSNHQSVIQKMSFVNSALAESHTASNEYFNIPLAQTNRDAIKVYVRLIFFRIGEIDTLNEKYQAQASIESRWSIELDKILPELSLNDQERLIHGKSISFLKYSETHWHPHLYIENALGDLKEQIKYSAKKSKKDNQIYICEHRDIKGLFWEKLELQYFPTDVQDLSISIASMLYNDKVLLIADPYRLSGVNREAFVDQQEWKLYEHVDSQQRYVTQFLCSNNNNNNQDDDTDTDDEQGTLNNKQRKCSILTVTCHAARRSNYFYWNGYCLILLITLAAFTSFSILPHYTHSRIQISSTLLLTSITFRLTVNRFLPTISYLTTMDKYAIGSICVIVGLIIWHAIVGAIVFLHVPDATIKTKGWVLYLDRSVLCVALGIYIIMHFIFLIWLYCVPYKCRRELKEKDIQYNKLISNKRDTSKNNSNGVPELLHP